MLPSDLASTIVKKYLASYDANAGVTQAACDLGKSGTLAEAIDRLAQVLKSNLADTAIRTAVVQSRLQVQSYDVADYIDLYDFCELLAGHCQQAEVQSACQQVREVLSSGGFVVQSGYKGARLQHSHGLSIYFPQKNISSLYATLDFTKQTSWDEFLREYQSSTRRPS